MTQRAVIMEIDEDTGARSVRDIFEWDTDRLDLTKRRLMRIVKELCGNYHLMIIQVDGPDKDKTLYERTIEVK